MFFDNNLIYDKINISLNSLENLSVFYVEKH